MSESITSWNYKSECPLLRVHGKPMEQLIEASASESDKLFIVRITSGQLAWRHTCTKILCRERSTKVKFTKHQILSRSTDVGHTREVVLMVLCKFFQCIISAVSNGRAFQARVPSCSTGTSITAYGESKGATFDC